MSAMTEGEFADALELLADAEPRCSHRFTRPTSVGDPRPYCTACLAILTKES